MTTDQAMAREATLLPGDEELTLRWGTTYEPGDGPPVTIVVYDRPPSVCADLRTQTEQRVAVYTGDHQQFSGIVELRIDE